MILFGLASVFPEMLRAQLYTPGAPDETTVTNGNVGIDVPLPLQKLHLSGYIRLDATNPTIFFQTTGSNLWELGSSGTDLNFNYV